MGLHASGLGLMVYSPSATDEIAEGSDTMPVGGALLPPLDRLVREQRVVFLATGSPQLDYALEVHVSAGAPPEDALASVAFPVEVSGGVLAFRDGYDPMDWTRDPPHLVRFTVPDGYYRVDAYWLPAPDLMRIRFVLSPSAVRLESDGWPELMYTVPRSTVHPVFFVSRLALDDPARNKGAEVEVQHLDSHGRAIAVALFDPDGQSLPTSAPPAPAAVVAAALAQPPGSGDYVDRDGRSAPPF